MYNLEAVIELEFNKI